MISVPGTVKRLMLQIKKFKATLSRRVILCSKIARYFKNPRLNFNYPPERPAFPFPAIDMIHPHM